MPGWSSFSNLIDHKREYLQMKNLFAVIGFLVVAKRGYELYREYSEMKREKERGMSQAC